MDTSGGADGSDSATVVVGIDDSSEYAALDLAAAEASVRRVPLRIVHAHRMPAREPSPHSRAVLDAAWERVGHQYPDVGVQHTLVGGGAGEVLVDESGRAGLLVLGGLGGLKFPELAEWLPVSVLAHVVTRAHCPVVVTGPSVVAAAARAPVRVAVDGTVVSLNALRFAGDWAVRHDAVVEATHVVPPGDFDQSAPELELRTPVQARLDGWVRTVQREYPAVAIQPVLVEHVPPIEALVAASQGAGVLAIGAAQPGHRLVPELIHRAACPVAVVRGWSPG